MTVERTEPTGQRAAGRTVARLLRFGAVGVVNTLIDLLLYMVLTGAGLPVVIANFISTSAGMGFSFVANRSFTFRSTGGGAARQGSLFFAFTVFGLWVIQPVVIFSVTALMGKLDWPTVGALGWLPKLCAIGLGLIWNYAAYSKVVFKIR